MSQISNDLIGLEDHYKAASLEPRPNVDTVPEELRNARPSKCYSILKTIARISFGIATCGISELIRQAYLGMKSIVCNAKPAAYREPRIGAKPKLLPAAAPNVDKSNASLASAVTGKKPLPAEYQAAVDVTVNELREKYGENYFPQGATLKDLVDAIDSNVVQVPGRDLFMAIKGASKALRPNDLQKILKDVYVPMLNCTVLTRIAQEKASQAGGLGGLPASTIVSNMLSYQPGLKEQVRALKSEADIQKLVSTMDLEQTMIEFHVALDNELLLARSVYGGSLNLDNVMSLNDETGHSVKSRMESYFTGNGLVTSQGLAAHFKEVIMPLLKQQAVETELSKKAQEMNVPLSPRSTSLLVKSLLRNPENANALANASGTSSLQAIINGMGIEALLQAQKAGIDNAYATHAEKLAPELRPIFRTYLEGCSFAPSSANATNQTVNTMVERMKHWRNFDGSEELRKPMNDNCKQIIGDDLKMLEGVPGNTDTTSYKDNIYETLLDDANRNDFTINTVKINRKPGVAQQEIVANLKSAAPNAKDQQFISKLINQRLWGTVLTPSTTGSLSNGTPLSELPGGLSIPCSSQLGRVILVDDKSNNSFSPTFTVQVSEDKKTAVVTASLEQNIVYDDMNGEEGMPHYGKIRFSYTINLNLSAHEQGQSVQDVKLAQRFIPINQKNGEED